jgi:hypothetical protein
MTVLYIYICIILLCRGKRKRQTTTFQTEFVIPLSSNVLKKKGHFKLHGHITSKKQKINPYKMKIP